MCYSNIFYDHLPMNVYFDYTDTERKEFKASKLYKEFLNFYFDELHTPDEVHINYSDTVEPSVNLKHFMIGRRSSEQLLS